MKYWIEIDASGTLISAGHGAQVPDGCIEVSEPAHPLTHAWDGEKLVLLPPRPSPQHRVRAGQWVLDEQLLAAEKRAMRNALLSRSDWTQMPDHPMSTERKAAWAAYRQQLRDITLDANWPHVEFPQTPE